MRYFLCGHTGSENRGCEAIIRSTVKVLNQRSGDIYLATYSPRQDAAMVRELGISMIPYARYPTPVHRYASVARRTIDKKSLAGFQYIERPLMNRLREGDVCLSVGGDTYCYGRPVGQMALNRFTHEHGIRNILWCCSVEGEKLHGEIVDDLKQYDCILAREGITYQNLIEAGIPVDRVIHCCDPAFFLDRRAVELPKGFAVGNTVGINVSNLVLNKSYPSAYENVTALVKHILKETDMSVCLIPHVYSIKNNSEDYPVLKALLQEIDDRRVCMVDAEYNCEELKYIISRCRFFVGARTHATIAAYSAGVPALALSYSVKSMGIARDLFGTCEGYALSRDELNTLGELIGAFDALTESEETIKARYAEALPSYRASLTKAIERYVINTCDPPRSPICDELQCTGCFACKAACPAKCIDAEADEEGFLRPRIDYSKCTDCGLCKRICPVANKPKDDGRTPEALAVRNRDVEIRMRSSSGGVFHALSQYVLQNGGAVFGACFDDAFNVETRKCTELGGLSAMRGSKYVQGDVKDTYREAKECLENGQAALFSGTPCQIGGLMTFLSRDYEKLYTVDLICHGAPSPKVWQKYLRFREKAANAKAVEISFRDKRLGWKKLSGVRFDFDDGTSYQTAADLYMKGFLQNIFLRPSCSVCSFKQLHRQADITLGDFWGADKLTPALDDDKGVSLVLLHSEKGRKLMEAISSEADIRAIDCRDALAENPAMLNSVEPAPLRAAFFRDVERLEMDALTEKYCGTNLFARLRRFMGRISWGSTKQ